MFRFLLSLNSWKTCVYLTRLITSAKEVMFWWRFICLITYQQGFANSTDEHWWHFIKITETSKCFVVMSWHFSANLELMSRQPWREVCSLRVLSSLFICLSAGLLKWIEIKVTFFGTGWHLVKNQLIIFWRYSWPRI